MPHSLIHRLANRNKQPAPPADPAPHLSPSVLAAADSFTAGSRATSDRSQSPQPSSPRVSLRLLEAERAAHGATRQRLQGSLEAQASEVANMRGEHEKALVAAAQAASLLIEDLQGALGKQDRTLTERAEQLASTQAALSTAESSLASTQAVLATTQQSLSAAQEALTAAEQKHAAAFADFRDELRTIGQLRQEEEDSLRYVLMRPNAQNQLQRGAIPRVWLQREPGSVLARKYAGEFRYACDDSGAALMTSNPENWPYIVDYLGFDAIPDPPPPTLLAEARYWQLDGLVAALTPAPEASPTTSAPEASPTTSAQVGPLQARENFGFSVDLTYSDYKIGETRDLTFSACGRDWAAVAHSDGLFLVLKSPGAATVQVRTSCKLGSGVFGPQKLAHTDPGWGKFWKELGLHDGMDPSALLDPSGQLKSRFDVNLGSHG